jgi:hypothetical protein
METAVYSPAFNGAKTMMSVYQEIGGGYSFASLRVGMTVRNPAGKEIYIQPGDDENTMRENITALDEISEDVTDAKRGTIAGMMLGDYFS